jgi:phosphoglycerate dehydrogenase-like enzyme
VVTNSAGIMGDTIAEHVVAGALFFLRGLDFAVSQQRRGVWDKSPFVAEGNRIRELAESRALIVGTGGIGSAVARRLSALGCLCTGVRRRSGLQKPEGFARIVTLDELTEELPGTDILVLAVPLTPATRGIVTRERLDCLPSGAIVVNVARGALLDEGALAQLLSVGRLRGAVLDVFQEEPLPASSPLWLLSNVLITPHVAAVSPRLFWKREVQLFVDNWERYRTGRPLRNRIDKEAGY